MLLDETPPKEAAFSIRPTSLRQISSHSVRRRMPHRRMPQLEQLGLPRWEIGDLDSETSAQAARYAVGDPEHLPRIIELEFRDGHYHIAIGFERPAFLSIMGEDLRRKMRV